MPNAIPRALLVLPVLIALLLSGCSSTGPAPVGSRETGKPAPAGYYRIRSGDTLYGIARRHKVGYGTLARWNKIAPPYQIYAGRLLRIEPPESGKAAVAQRTAAENSKSGSAGPGTGKSGSGSSSAGKTASGSTKTAAVRQETGNSKTSGTSSGAKKGGSKRSTSGLDWRWPLKGRIVQTFRKGDRTRQGIRIAGQPGQKVLAAEAGTVVYSGSGLKGYGNLIIVKHNTDYLSAYGFNRRLLVEEGTRVKSGQTVAEVGPASDGGYLLHFEIRRDGTAVDPMVYLPGSR